MAHKPEPKYPKSVQPQLPVNEPVTALYLRVSTEKQADEGYSLDAQLEKLQAYCLAQGWTYTADHTFVDEGISGKHDARPAFQAMMAAAHRREIDRVLVVKLDRLARNTALFLNTVADLKAHGVAFASIAESFDTSTDVGRMMLTILAGFAEMEASTIRERLLTGRRQKAKVGGYNGSQHMLGYAVQDGVFTPNDDAATVQRIFAMFLAGGSCNAIARQLASEGTPTQRGGKWAQATVRGILLNGAYAGLAQWDGAEVPAEHITPIVTVAEYEAAKARLATLRRGNPNFGR